MDEKPALKVNNERENTTREPEKPVRGLIWYSLLFVFIGLAFLFFACTRYYVEVPEGFTDEIAKATAHTFLIAIAFYVIRRLSHVKTGKKGTTFFYISIIFCILTVYQSVSLLIKASDTGNTLSKVASIYDDVYEGKPISKMKTNGRDQYGEMTPLMNIMLESANTIQKDFSAMNYEIQECQLDSIFKPETLTQAQLLSEALSHYETAINVLDKYEKQIQLRFDECLINIRNSSLPENLKNRALSSAKKENDQGLKSMLELFEIRRKFIAEARNLLIYIKSRPNSFKYQNGKMVVENEEDADFGRTSMSKLRTLLQEEDNLIRKIEQEVSTKLRQVNELVR